MRPAGQDGPDLFGDPEPEAESVRPAPSGRRFIIEADGGSRGNPGIAGYGALVRDAETGEVLDREGLSIGVATNNVAEYSGLIAALEMAKAIDPGASIEVRMDSRLVVEQMKGVWKVKHPDMKPLALKATRLRPATISFTWIPREQNKDADALANLGMDGKPVERRHKA